MGASSLSGMINAGAWLENEFDSIEVIEIGRPATAPEQDFTMQVCGRFYLTRSPFTARRST
jgi:hypothetical protein